jgi:hypothetical protein
MKICKKLMAAILILGTCLFSHGENKNLILHWDFSNNNNNFTLDASGRGNNGKLYNTAVSERDKNNFCFKFNGKDSYISSLKGNFLKSEKGTISLWIKFDNSDTWEYFLKIEKSTYKDFLVLGKDKKNRILLRIEDNNKPLGMLYTVDTINDNHWHNISVTQDGNGVKIYIDGVEAVLCKKGKINSKSWTSHLNNSRIEAGRGRGWNYFKGCIDDVRVFDRALSAEDIRKESGINVKVAIFNEGAFGARGIYDALSEKKYISADLMNNLNIEKLIKYDVLIIPCSTLPPPKAANYKNVIINYVKSGYGVIFFHDACGYRKNWGGSNLLFPEIATVSGRDESYYMKAGIVSHSILSSLPENIKHSYFDHICLIPGKTGKTLLIDKNTGAPTLVAGKIGYGKVIKSGNLAGLNSDNEEVKPAGDELTLLVNCVLWANLDTPKKLSGLKGENLLDLTKLLNQQKELEKIWTLLQTKLYYYKCKFNNNIELLAWNIERNYKFSHKRKNELIEKLNVVSKNYLNEINNFDSQIKNYNGLFRYFTHENNITHDKNKLRTIDNKIKEFRQNASVIQNKLMALNSKFFTDLASVKQMASPPASAAMPKMNLKQTVAWLKNNYTKEHINFHGMQNPGFHEAMGFLKKIHTDILLDNISFRQNSFDFKNGRLKEEFFKIHGFSSQEEYFKTYYGGAADNNLRIILALAFPELTNSGNRYGVDWGNAKTIKKLKDKMTIINNSLEDYPAFIGFHFDEIMFTGGWSEICIEKFRTYLKDKYTDAERKKLNFPDLDKIYPPDEDSRYKDRVLWTEHREFVAETLFNAFQDITNHAHSLNKIIEILFSPATYFASPYSINISKISKLPDIVAVDPYLKGCRDEAFIIDLLRGNTESRIQAVLGKNDSTPQKIKQDFSIAIAHADSLYPFSWIFYWKDKPHPVFDNVNRQNDKWNKSLSKAYGHFWIAGGWKAMSNIFNKIERLENYLVKTAPITPVAQLYSERSAGLDAYTPKPFIARLKVPYAINQMGIYSALSQEHIQVQPVFAEGITLKRLNDFKVLILADARSLKPSEINTVKEWVKNGGQLLATASTTVFDRWGRKNKNYLLNDVFGCDYIATSANADTIIPTDKPVMNFCRVKYLPTDKFDIVKPTTAKVLGKWNNKYPAVMINKYGNGNVIFISASGLGRCFQGKNWKVNFYLNKNFNPGVRELLKNSIMYLLELSGNSLPFGVANCPATCEVTLRKQNNLYMMHFLNYADKPITDDITVSLNIPTNRVKRIFCPESGKEITFKRKSATAVSFQTSQIDPHRMIVIDTAN